MMGVRENEKEISNPDECGFLYIHCDTFRLYCLGYLLFCCCQGCFLGGFTKQIMMGVRENEKEISNPDECGFLYIHCDTFRLYCLGYLLFFVFFNVSGFFHKTNSNGG